MLYAKNMLNRYLTLKTSVEEIAEQLTLKVCEVEEIHQRVLPDLVVIGKVTEVKKHPNADSLVICQLDCGDKGNYQICTGGENVVGDSWVPVALPGCYLPSINLKIEPREMRGEASNGMICSKAELGIPEDLEEHRIWTLQYGPSYTGEKVQVADMDDITDADNGVALQEKYPRLASWSIDVENKTITHRPDMFGHFGLANELAAIFPDDISFHGGRKYQKDRQEPHRIYETLDNAEKTTIDIQVPSPFVHTYAILELQDVQSTQSDLYLRTMLYDMDIQPKSNWVDFSNIYMYLSGQPVHFFDKAKVEGSIIVRQAQEGETFTDLFGDEHILTPEDIVIADTVKILALAGIVGSNNSGVDQNTTDILVEIANFDDVQVRKTAMRLGLRTDAQVRYEKQIHPLYTLHNVTLFLDELQYFSKSLGSFTFAGLQRWTNDTHATPTIQKIELDTSRIERMMFGSVDGCSGAISDETILKILTHLGCSVSPDREVTIPIWRGPDDLTQQADLLEEITRMYGYDALPSVAYKDEPVFLAYDREVIWQRTIEEYLSDTCHADQIETYPWLHKRWHTYIDVEQLYTLQNPLAPEQRYLRNCLWPSLLEVIAKNAPVSHTIHIFDIGKTWQLGRETKEHNVLGVAHRQKHHADRSDHTMLHVKSLVAPLLEKLSVKGKLDYIPIDLDHDYLHQQASAIITLNQQPIGSLLTFHPQILDMLKLDPSGQLSVLELDLTAMEDGYKPNKKASAHSYSTLQDQIITRDINLVIDAEQSWERVTTAISKVKEVDTIEIFDLYAGEHLPSDKKSIGIRITLHAPRDQQLTTAQTGDIIQKAIDAAEQAGASLR